MHDPLTVAFTIPYPWPWPTEDSVYPGYRPPLLTIWHKDPERDGSDDSCGWFAPCISKEMATKIEEIATEENKYMVGEYGYRQSPEQLIYNIWRVLSWQLHKRRTVTPRELVAIWDLATNHTDNLRLYATSDREQDWQHLWFCVYRQYLRFHRPWWKHPRFHLHHWRFQLHPWQTFKRWAFERCDACGKGFRWGYSPVTRTGKDSYHHECADRE